MDAIMHYFDHDEYEMAYEGLLIDLIKANRRPSNFEFGVWRELAVDLGLDRETVFDSRLWPKFLSWGTEESIDECIDP